MRWVQGTGFGQGTDGGVDGSLDRLPLAGFAVKSPMPVQPRRSP